MPNFWDKSIAAEKEGAHVAAILYRVLYTENFTGLDYNQHHAVTAVQAVLDYAKNLKKPEDREALETFCALQYRDLLVRSGADVDITAKIAKAERREPATDDVEIC